MEKINNIFPKIFFFSPFYTIYFVAVEKLWVLSSSKFKYLK